MVGRTKSKGGAMHTRDRCSDPDLHDEGVVDEAAGNTRDALGHARRKVGQAIEDIGNAIKK